MTQSLFSTYWYRVADLRPALQKHVRISRHIYRGRPWYILHNPLNGKSHRFNSSAFTFIAMLDGRKSLQDIWDILTRQETEPVAGQDEIISILSLLHDTGLIRKNISPGLPEVLSDKSTENQSAWNRFSNPFAVRFKLCNPDKFITARAALTRPLFSKSFLTVWLLFFFYSVYAATAHMPALAKSFEQQFTEPYYLILLWLVYPVLKLCHELGHAFAVKRWGGNVPELGILFLVFTPIPYVDASASGMFADKSKRIIVSAAGVMTELFAACIALQIWLHCEPGVLKDIAFNVMLIGGASGIFFNGNPLLRYDGYYILADFLEIPNLARRSRQYLGYLIKRFVFKINSAASSVTAPGERFWFSLYGPLAFAYRMMVVICLVWMIGNRYFIIGVLLAVWGATALIVIPLVKNMAGFLKLPEIRLQKKRLFFVLSAAVVLTGGFLCLPYPLRTVTQGVVWLPEQSAVKAETNLEIIKLVARDGQQIDRSAPVAVGIDPFLRAEHDLLKAELAELSARYNAIGFNDRVASKQLADEILMTQKNLTEMEERLKKFIIYSPAQGRLMLLSFDHLPGRFIKQGEDIGVIVNAENAITIRAVIAQTDIDLVRQHIDSIDVRFAHDPGRNLHARIKRLLPTAQLTLPSPALGTAGGGNIAVDPTDPDKLRSLESYFQVDLELAPGSTRPFIGGRAYVRFNHGFMTVGRQIFRNLRQLFIRNFYV